MQNLKQKIIVLCGPTAVGKTELSLQMAERFSCEIIGVDSMQVYRHMDIGTAKPTAAERKRIRHYLIDVADPDENYSLGRFVRDADRAIREIDGRGKIPLLTGGTGLYFKGLLEGVFNEEDIAAAADKSNGSLQQSLRRRLKKEGAESLHRELAGVDPASAARIHPNDTQRVLRGLEIYYSTGIPWSRHLADQRNKAPRYRVLKIGLHRPRQQLYERIDRRVQLMVRQGLLDEVKKLLAMGYDTELHALQSIGYRHMINFLEGVWTWEQTLELLARDTRHYAKRQLTWFNNDREILWHDVQETDTIFTTVRDFLNRETSHMMQKE